MVYSSSTSKSSSLLFLLCFLLPLSSATALTITEVLRQHYPEFSSFTGYLTKTGLADSVNEAQNITVLAGDNGVMSGIESKPTEEVERLLRHHLVRGYYRARHLLQL